MLHGSQLVVGTRPFLPRAVRHKGQPLSAIKELGFNTVVLNNPVTAEQLKEAAQNELWLVAPPPHVGPGSGTDSLVASSPHDSVLAWNVSGQGSNGNPDVARGRATSIRRADDQPPRPVLCAAQSGGSDYSRAVDLLVVDAPMPASSERLNLARAHWDNVASQLRPGVPWWATIQIAPIMPSSLPSHPVKGTTGTNASNAVAVRQLVFEVPLLSAFWSQGPVPSRSLPLLKPTVLSRH